MMSESDGVDEEIRAALQVALTVAARLGEQAARAREQQSRTAQASSTQAAYEDSARLAAERDAARAALAPVHRADWWDGARAEDVATAYETATAWARIDPEAAHAKERIVTEVRDRYGLDAGEGPLREAVDRAEHERDKGRSDEREASALMLAAGESDRRAEDAADQAELAAAAGAPQQAEAVELDRAREDIQAQGAELAGGMAYDSAGRRDQLAAHLEATVDNKTAVQARLLADTSQARPPSDATTRTSTKSPKARLTRTSAAGRQTQRSDRAR